MPPRKSASAANATDIHHITFHFFKSAVLLSVPSATTLSELKTQLLSALLFQPLTPTLSANLQGGDLPKAEGDFRIYEDPQDAGDDLGEEEVIGLRCLDEGEGGRGGGKSKGLARSVRELGWGRWKKLYVSFRSPDGSFADPEYTVPDVEDEGEEVEVV